MRAIATALTFLMISLAGILHADGLTAAQDDVILTVSGNLEHPGLEGSAQFDLEMLRQLPVQSFSTSTIWTEGEVKFSGVALSELLNLLYAKGHTIRAHAINDYSVEIPMDSVTGAYPIIAYMMEDAPIARRKKGPLWIVYPYDSNPAFQTEVIYSRSI